MNLRKVSEVAADITVAGIRMNEMHPARRVAEPLALVLEDRASVLDGVLELLEGIRGAGGTFEDAIQAIKQGAANDRERALKFRTASYDDLN